MRRLVGVLVIALAFAPPAIGEEVTERIIEGQIPIEQPLSCVEARR